MRTIGLVALIILLLLSGGFFSYDAMREALDQTVSQSLDAINDATSAAMLHWIDSQMREVSSWTQQPNIQELVAVLGAATRSEHYQKSDLFAHPSRQVIREFLEPVLLEEGFLCYLVVNREGLVLTAYEEAHIGTHIPPEMMLPVARVFQRDSHFSKPALFPFAMDEPTSAVGQPYILIGSVVPNENGAHSCALLFLLDPHKDFSRILSIGSFGKTGNTYAIDQEGRMLSRVRFQEELQRIGLFSENRSSILNMTVRDPGRKLKPDTNVLASLSEQPLTSIVSMAVHRREGLVLRGYRDYRGELVYGAWKWSERYDMGVITEMSVLEAFNIIRPAGITVFILFFLLIFCGVSLILLYIFGMRKRQQVLEIRQLGQYELIEKLGEGGIGVVYRARHAMLRRPTAIKLLRPNRVDDADVARFEREVQLVAQLTHPNTIDIYDYGKTEDGLFYYAMEFLRGLSLAQLIEMEGELPPGRVVHLLLQVCGSLEEAHSRGMIHRDIKPLNIFICQRGLIADFVKVLDFGLVKEVARHQTTRQTDTNVLMGTPEYIAPERIRDPGCRDPRSDLYSLGAMAYNMLTAHETYAGSSREILQHALASPIPRPSAIAHQFVPADLDDLVCQLLAKNPDERPQSVQSTIALLEAIHLEDRWGNSEAMAWKECHASLFELETIQ